MKNDQIIEFLAKLITIESVSTDPGRFSQIVNAAHLLENKLQSLGFQTEIISAAKTAPPLLIASRVISPDAKTIGIYGHYDVQPEDPVSEWNSEPFYLSIRDGKIYGRGVADNKGHVVQNIAAIERLITDNRLTHNVVFILEGEEETGSIHFEKLVKKAEKILNTIDVFFVTDTSMHAKNVPQIFYALRGLIYFELKVQIGERDLHSGVYGNRVYNPVQILADLLSKIKNIHTGRILIPTFYDEVRTLSVDELQQLQKVARSEDEEQKEANVYSLTTIDNISVSLVTKILPSCDVNGILGGYTGVGSKTVIPKEAYMKFSFRLIENQSVDHVEKIVQSFIQKHMPKGVHYNLITHSKAAPFYTTIDNEFVKKTAQVFRKVFGTDTVFNRSGGSIPASEVFQRLFKRPVILTGFTLPDDNIHSPNENFDEEMFWKGITALTLLYSNLS